MDDNLYPNQGDYFTADEPDEQVVERNQEEAEVINATPIILEEIKRLESRIAHYGSIDSIDLSVTFRPEEFMHVVAANKLVKSCLVNEKEILEGLLQEYAKD